VNVRVVIAGRGYPAAEPFPGHLTLADGCSLDEALQTLAALAPAGRGLAGSCLVAVSGSHLGTVRSHRPCVLRDGDELTIIAPVAGG
jgi:hypothetical protein